jgi:hypothetical protein
VELGRRILDRLIEDLKPISKVERTPALDGRFMTMVFGPDRDKIKRVERQAAHQQKTPASSSAAASSASAGTSQGVAASLPSPSQSTAQGTS